MVNNNVVGIDLSLTRTGLALASSSVSGILYTGAVTSEGKKDATWSDRNTRSCHISNQINDWIADHADGVITGFYIEGPSYGSTTGQQHDRSGLWWRVYARLSATAPVFVVAPQSRAKYATGAGNAGKDKVLAATVRQFLDVDVWCNDIADAVQLAAMGARDQGWPIDGIKPKASLDSIAKISQ